VSCGGGVFPVVDAALGGLPEIVGAFVQRSGRKGDQLEKQGQTQQIAHLGRLALMGEMAASLAHELNQPLTAILGNAGAGQRFLDNGVTDVKELRELLRDIISDAERAGKIIRGIREMVKKGEARREPINMNQIVETVVTLTKPDAVNRSSSVITDLDPELIPVEGDPVQLQQVLLNLVLNAFDAMQETPVHLRRIVLSTRLQADFAVRTAVRDFGTGLSETVHQQIFEHFFSTKKDGLGMGLAIARSIIESFGGVIDASNAPGGGTLFYFTLPASTTKLHERPAPKHCLCR
jgi:two-component system, LuxR family, sensor kinase FixL